jgi:hypothetical protein
MSWESTVCVAYLHLICTLTNPISYIALIDALLLYSEKGEKVKAVDDEIKKEKQRVKMDEAGKAARALLKEVPAVRQHIDDIARQAEAERVQEELTKKDAAEKPKQKEEADPDDDALDMAVTDNQVVKDSDQAEKGDDDGQSATSDRSHNGEAHEGQEASAEEAWTGTTATVVTISDDPTAVDTNDTAEVVTKEVQSEAPASEQRGRSKKSVVLSDSSKRTLRCGKKAVSYKLSDPNDYIDLRIAKVFRKGLFFGTIIEYSPSTENKEQTDLWRVEYDDGDVEDYDEKELVRFLKLYVTNLEKDENPNSKATEFAIARRLK